MTSHAQQDQPTSAARPYTPVSSYRKHSPAPRSLLTKIKTSNCIGRSVEANYNFWTITDSGLSENLPQDLKGNPVGPARNEEWVKYNQWARSTVGMRPHRPFIPRRSAPGRFSSYFITPLNVVTAQGVAKHVRTFYCILNHNLHMLLVDLNVVLLLFYTFR